MLARYGGPIHGLSKASLLSPLHLACHEGSKEKVETLIKRGASLRSSSLAIVDIYYIVCMYVSMSTHVYTYILYVHIYIICIDIKYIYTHIYTYTLHTNIASPSYLQKHKLIEKRRTEDTRPCMFLYMKVTLM